MPKAFILLTNVQFWAEPGKRKLLSAPLSIPSGQYASESLLTHLAADTRYQLGLSVGLSTESSIHDLPLTWASHSMVVGPQERGKQKQCNF